MLFYNWKTLAQVEKVISSRSRNCLPGGMGLKLPCAQLTTFPRDPYWQIFSFVFPDNWLTSQTPHILRSQILSQTKDVILDPWTLIDCECLKTLRTESPGTKPEGCKQSIKPINGEGKSKGEMRMSDPTPSSGIWMRAKTGAWSSYCWILWLRWRS